MVLAPLPALGFWGMFPFKLKSAILQWWQVGRVASPVDAQGWTRHVAQWGGRQSRHRPPAPCSCDPAAQPAEPALLPAAQLSAAAKGSRETQGKAPNAHPAQPSGSPRCQPTAPTVLGRCQRCSLSLHTPGVDLAQSHPAVPALLAAPFRIPVWAGPTALSLPPPPRAAFQLLLNAVQAGFITRALKRLQTNRKNREQERAERSIGAGGA